MELEGRLSMHWLCNWAWLLVSNLGSATTPQSFDSPVLPVWLQTAIARIHVEKARANPELTIALVALRFAKDRLYEHLVQVAHAASFTSRSLKQALVLPLIRVCSFLDRTIATFADQHDYPIISDDIMDDLTDIYLQLSQTAALCNFIARNSSAKAVQDFFRELHAVIFRSLGVRQFYLKLSSDFIIRLSQSLDPDFDEAEQVNDAYRQLELLDAGALAATLAPCPQFAPPLHW